MHTHTHISMHTHRSNNTHAIIRAGRACPPSLVTICFWHFGLSVLLRLTILSHTPVFLCIHERRSREGGRRERGRREEGRKGRRGREKGRRDWGGREGERRGRKGGSREGGRREEREKGWRGSREREELKVGKQPQSHLWWVCWYWIMLYQSTVQE